MLFHPPVEIHSYFLYFVLQNLNNFHFKYLFKLANILNNKVSFLKPKKKIYIFANNPLLTTATTCLIMKTCNKLIFKL